MMANEEIDYKLAAEQLRTGKPLFGKGGALAHVVIHMQKLIISLAEYRCSALTIPCGAHTEYRS